VKILLITPGIAASYNDNYHAYKHIANEGNHILAISQKQNINKGYDQGPNSEYEKIGGIEIYRLFDNISQIKSIISHQIKYKIIRHILNDFNPDVIFVEELTCLPLAIKIKKKYKLPLVLRVEFAYNEKKPYQTFGKKLKYFKNKITGDWLSRLVGRFIWEWACKNVDSLISCYYEDSLRKITTNEKLISFYVPWPSYIPQNMNNYISRDNYGIFIGSFDKHKNLVEFSETIPLIFKNTKIDKFYIVGDGEDLPIINNLMELYPAKIIHIKSVDREKCLKLIKSAFFSYSPAIRGGWGFIGDSWAVGTPLVVTHNHYDFKDGEDSIVADKTNIAERINQLHDPQYYKSISTGGFLRYSDEHSAVSVGQKYLKICSDLISSSK
jgi:glycosyltransferase involved in cell wall biosynthesis